MSFESEFPLETEWDDNVLMFQECHGSACCLLILFAREHSDPNYTNVCQGTHGEMTLKRFRARQCS